MTMQPSDDDKRRLLALLAEDTESPEDAQALLPLMMRVKQSPVLADELTRARVAQLALVQLHGQRRSWRQRLADWWPLLLLRAQVRVVQREIWLASALIMLLGGAVTVILYAPHDLGDLPLVLVAPVVAAVGVALLYSTDEQSVMEIEQATPTSPQLILLLRLAMVFGVDFMLGLLGSLVLTIANPNYSLWPLVITWLAPMTFLSALAFLMSVMFADAQTGTVVSLLLWSIQVLNRFLSGRALAAIPILPDLLAADVRVWLLLLAVPMLAAALWLSGRETSTIRRFR
jgi:hypothetical protein